MKQFLLFIVALFATATVMKAAERQAAYFDFTKKVDGKVCGVADLRVTDENDKDKKSQSLFGITFEQGDISITIEQMKDNVDDDVYLYQPHLGYLAANKMDSIYLVIPANASDTRYNVKPSTKLLVQSSTNRITRIVIDDYTYCGKPVGLDLDCNFSYFVTDCGSITRYVPNPDIKRCRQHANHTWICGQNDNVMSVGIVASRTEDLGENLNIKSITVYTDNEADPELVTSISALAGIDNGEKVELSEAGYTCIKQSDDKKYTLFKDDENQIFYLYKPDGLSVAFAKADKLTSTVFGVKSTVDGVSVVETEDGNPTNTAFLTPVPLRYATSLTSTNIGEIAKMKGTIVADGDNFVLHQTTASAKINNIFNDALRSTQGKEKATITGIIGYDSPSYTIQPISIVIAISTDVDNVTDANAPQVEVSGNTIKIVGEWRRNSICTIDGKMISANRSEAECGHGVYIVTVDGRAIAKVIL